MVETIDAEPIQFNFSNNEIINSSDSDTLSLYSSTHESHQISRDELINYFKTMETRNYGMIPSVGNKGLPALEVMNIDNFDPSMAEKMEKHYFRRGSYYLLMFLKKQIGFKPARSSLFNLDLKATESLTSFRSRLSSKRSTSPKVSPPPIVINSDDKYLLNMGTIRVRGYKKQKDFKVIVDPNFPFSYIDIDTIIGQTAAVKAMNGACFSSSSFKVVATPEYDPESFHNRVSIDVEIIPWGEDFDDVQSLKSLPNTVKTVIAGGTGHSSASPPLSPDSPTDAVSSPKKKKLSFLNFKRPPNYHQPPAGFSLFAPIPQNVQVNGSKKSTNKLAGSSNDTSDVSEAAANVRANSGDLSALTAEVPDLFKKQWTEASDEIITLMELNLDYPCILGKDWLNRLNTVVQTR